MHSLYKSVDKTQNLVSLDIAIITKIKNLASPVSIEYHKVSNGASKKDKRQLSYNNIHRRQPRWKY